MQHIFTKATFPALLKTPDDKLLEEGKAAVSVATASVDFVSSFVQLFKMDTPLKIVILKDNVEIQSFSGKVYLSSPKMLRLVEVTDIVLPGAKTACLCDVATEGTVRATTYETVKGKFFLAPKKIISRNQRFTVDINGVSMRAVHFTTDKSMERGQFIKLEMTEPQIDDVLLEIEKKLEFGQPVNSYRCIIKELNATSRMNLDDYIAELCHQQLRIFH